MAAQSLCFDLRNDNKILCFSVFPRWHDKHELDGAQTGSIQLTAVASADKPEIPLNSRDVP